MVTLSGTTTCAVVIGRHGGGLTVRYDTVPHIGEEFCLDEQVGLYGDSVTTGGGVVGTIVLVLQVEKDRGNPTMFPLD